MYNEYISWAQCTNAIELRSADMHGKRNQQIYIDKHIIVTRWAETTLLKETVHTHDNKIHFDASLCQCRLGVPNRFDK